MEVSRRTTLIAAGTGIAAVAGCIGTDDESDGNGSDGDGEGTTADGGDVDGTVRVGPEGEFRFDPETLEIDPGDTVEFVWESDGHNVAVRSQPADAGWEGVADVQDDGYSHAHTFEIAGEYDYVCEPHESRGMAGTVLVGDPATGEDDGEDDERDGGGYGFGP